MSFSQSIVSYPERGPYGDNLFRGNTSGYLIKDLIETYQPSSVYDPMAGSGTTRDVCKHLKVAYYGTDIHAGQDVTNLTHRKQIQDALFTAFGKGPEMIFWHPPYWNMIGYTDNPGDLSQVPTYDGFLRVCEDIMAWLGKIIAPGGFLALLVADLKKRNSPTTFFLSDDITERARVYRCGFVKEFRYIKVQHKTLSGGDVGHLDVPMVHEYMTIMRSTKYNG